MRWWLYVVAALTAIALLGLILTIYDKRIAAWLERQNEFEKFS
ncbi:hypothetical protein J2X16_004875 [Pelomonas aquatica]|uniref:Uncharacterized protein n=1 Tax=Pelomonas aquatica TaxID=431058 RepID=A0ABU1ZHN0_9BURK|nr:hypothetical protein [Pelomonas aquatica]MDR7299505.1 hypothetical protein [Pelomonas aquatica]